MRDCENCARCGRDGCKSWDCDFIPRKEAIEAWKEKNAGKKYVRFDTLPDGDGDIWDSLTTDAAKAIDEAIAEHMDCPWK